MSIQKQIVELFPDARENLEVAEVAKILDESPLQISTWTQLAEALNNSGDSDLDRDSLVDLCAERFPDRKAFKLLQVKCMIEAGRYEKALVMLEELKASGSYKSQRLTPLVYTCTIGSGNLEEIADLDPEPLYDLTPRSVSYLSQIVSAKFRLGQDNAGKEILINISARGSIARPILKRAATAISETSGQEALYEFLDWVYENTNAGLGVLKLLRRFNLKNPNSSAQLIEKKILKRELETDPVAAAWVFDILHRHNIEVSPEDPIVARVLEAVSLSFKGDYPDAVKILETILDDSIASKPITKPLKRLIAIFNLLNNTEPLRDVISENMSGEVLVSPNAGNGRVAVVFCGLRNRVGGVPIPIFDRLLAGAGVTGVYLCDAQGISGCGGIKSLGVDALETTESLKQLLDELDAQDIVAIGISSGGYGALRYGIALNLRKISAFSGGTVARPSDMKELGDPRVPALASRVEELDPKRNFVAPVRKVLPDSSFEGRIDLHYGALMLGDVKQASTLTGMPNVRLCPQSDFADHNSFMPLILDGKLDELFE